MAVAVGNPSNAALQALLLGIQDQCVICLIHLISDLIMASHRLHELQQQVTQFHEQNVAEQRR
jgi:hypothetical protein